MSEALQDTDLTVKTDLPPVHERANPMTSELPPDEVINRMRALPDRQRRLVEMLDALRKTDPR